MYLFKPALYSATLAASLMLPTLRVSAQDDAPPPPPPPNVSAPAAPNAPVPPPPPGAPGGPGGMEQFRQRMNERLKTALKANDEEWSVIEPLLAKVQDKLRDSMATRFGGMMGRGGPGGPGGEGRRRGGDNNAQPAQGGPQAQGENGGRRRDFRPPSSAEATALEGALQDDTTNVSDIKAKLAALRTERQKATADLESARADLKKVLNMRQEAVLVLAGMLD